LLCTFSSNFAGKTALVETTHIKWSSCFVVVYDATLNSSILFAFCGNKQPDTSQGMQCTRAQHLLW